MRFAIGVLAAGWLSSWIQPAAAAWTHLGSVTSVDRGDSAVTLHCRPAAVRVEAVDEHVIRIRLAPDGTFGPDFSWAVPDLITAAGGTPLMERVGHAFIKARMDKEGAVFAGEVTGHYYFKDFFFADSGIVPSLIIMEMLSKKKAKLSELLAPLEAKYFISGEINTRISGDPKAKMDELAETFKAGKVEWLDGVSVTFDDWHSTSDLPTPSRCCGSTWRPNQRL
jgi:hypothetical protein